MPKRLIPLAVAAALAGCSMIPGYERATPEVPAKWADGADLGSGARQAKTTEWRAFFPDARLQALIDAALEHNFDMRIAVARVEEARGIFGIARADRFPTINVGGGRNASLTPGDLSSTRQPLNAQRYDANFAMPAFELDFWGRVKNLSAAAEASYFASQEAQRAFRLSLVADVANGYLSLLELDERTALARATAASREEARRLIAKRREVGLASDLDYLTAEGAAESARADLAGLENQRAAAEHGLTLLVGKLPETLPQGRSLAEQGIVADLEAGVPSEVLLARPDVLAAEQRLVAAHANIGAARAAFLPKILLTATLGTASASLSGLFEAGSRAWAFQPVLAMPLFDAGRTSSNVDVAEARKVIAVADYEKTIQTAFREIADLLVARQKLAEQANALEATARTESQRLKLAEARYSAGISSYLDVLDAQRQSNAAQQGALQARRALLSSAAQLYKALGGGEF